MPELSAEQKNAISWTICCTNAFVMLTSGLVIDIKKVLENLTHKRGFKSGIIIGKKILHFQSQIEIFRTYRSACLNALYDLFGDFNWKLR